MKAAWLESAACAQIGDPDLWFPPRGGTARPAQRVCAACPVAAECLELWRSLPPDLAIHGVWAGRTGRVQLVHTDDKPCAGCGEPIPRGQRRRCDPCTVERRAETQRGYRRQRVAS
jgi:hypothetical protein